MKFLFLMDPLETVVMEKDTTFIFMLEAHRRGHEIYYLPEDGISLQQGRLHFHAVKVKPQTVAHEPFIEEHLAELTDDQIHAVFVRADPPFDQQYLINTWLLEFLPKHVVVINHPLGIRTVNEKIWASRFNDLVPATIISSNQKSLLDFVAREKNVIAKPTGGYGGGGVFHIKPADTNTKVILEHLTDNWNTPAVLQRYIPDAQNGDKRILLLNGEPLGALLRVHAEGDHRNNLFAGGQPQAAQITKRDEQIIAALKPYLLELGLYLVGLDIIGDYLIEVNVTSPTCLQEMNKLYNVRLEEKVITFVEKLCRS
ncbi:MAG: glutathione synthase [Candidatus Omnitrophica bacterium]|nr:glutathione synthase [Candidatus Omnitrophota bacterium]